MRIPRALFISLTVIPSLAAFCAAHGQSASVPRRFGLVAGMNSATFVGKDATTPTPHDRTAFVGGVMLVSPFQPNLAFQPELLFSMKGAVFKDPSGSATFRMNYLEFPVLLRFDVPAAGMIRPYLLAGPAVAFRLSCDVVVTGAFSGGGTCDDVVGPGGPKFATVDYSAVFGGGLTFGSDRPFTIGARYEPSLSKLQKGTDANHRVITVLMTFELPTGR